MIYNSSCSLHFAESCCSFWRYAESSLHMQVSHFITIINNIKCLMAFVPTINRSIQIQFTLFEMCLLVLIEILSDLNNFTSYVQYSCCQSGLWISPFNLNFGRAGVVSDFGVCLVI